MYYCFLPLFLIHTFFTPLPSSFLFLLWDPSPLSVSSSLLYKSKDELHGCTLPIFVSLSFSLVSFYFIFVRTGNTAFFFPFSTCVLLSLLLFSSFYSSGVLHSPSLSLPPLRAVHSSLFVASLLLYYIGLHTLCIPLLLSLIVFRFAS